MSVSSRWHPASVRYWRPPGDVTLFSGMNNTQITSGSISIAATADKVYRMVSDLTRTGEWSPEATGGKWIGGATGPAEGARFKGTNKHGRKKWSTTVTVLEASAPDRFSFANKLGSKTLAVWSYQIRSTGRTSCTVTETWTDHRGPIIDILGKAITGVQDRAGHTKSMINTTLEKLKATAEFGH